MRVFGGMGKSIERTKDRGRGQPQPVPAHSRSMSFRWAIPGQVALQQSLPPLRPPPPILPQSGQAVESVPRTSRRPPHPGLDAEKTSRCPAREKCFYLTSPLIEPALTRWLTRPVYFGLSSTACSLPPALLASQRIWPESLIPTASVNVKPVPDGMRVLRSTNPFAVEMKGTCFPGLNG
jgi:hypothetical protein